MAGAKKSECTEVEFTGGRIARFCRKERTAAGKAKRIRIAKQNLESAKPTVCTAAWKKSLRAAGNKSKRNAKWAKNLMKQCA